MATSLTTLVQLLRDLYDEVNACLEREGAPGEGKVPLALGDYIVVTYNTYLTGAKGLVEDPLIQAMPKIHSWDPSDSGQVPAAGPKQARHQERQLQKMAEVRLAARALGTVLEGLTASPAAGQTPEAAVALSQLDSLDAELRMRVDHSSREFGGASREFGAEQGLVDQYNRALKILQEELSDPVLDKLFVPLPDVADDSGGEREAMNARREAMASLRMAVQTLKDYLARGR
jgi:hypothetical protein